MNPPAIDLKKRINSIDLLRGIIMVIMAIDHVRDFFHITASTDSPTNLATTTPQLFFTRWITHFCAPVFIFLAGTSIYLQGLRKTKSELSFFLIKRGTWLLLIEFFVMSFLFTFNPFYNVIILQVIWAIGISMVILGLMVWLPFRVILITGLIIVFAHNLLDYPEAARNGDVGVLWNLAHAGFFKRLTLFPKHFVMILYPFLPWTGVMFCGYCLGKLFEPQVDASKRRKILIILGVLLTVLFIVLRFINQYGDRSHWSYQKNGMFTLLSFLNLTKYPPSLMYLCMTLGPSIILLAFFEKIKNKVTDFFIVFGRVPFFYYIIHFFLIHFLCLVTFFIEGYGKKDIIPEQSPFLFRPDNFGFSLWGVYAVWLFIIIVLYPLCKKYGEYKKTHHQWWLSYL
ncbi:MAG TPA: heparan-alpha-glucosaminide N-acetyltransferase domain-containing protein [Puia sp.]|jgi:uncharacterized membrane protein|nr:heparan-alpha-glucosaminide N-acetyltransferase domain-containing protein [Puia sp.]